MGLTDAEGNAIPADDPRLPTVEATEALKAKADAVVASLKGAGYDVPADFLETESQVEALVRSFIPPDGPIRRLFEHRVQEARFRMAQEVVQEAVDRRRDVTAPRLFVPGGGMSLQTKG